MKHIFVGLAALFVIAQGECAFLPPLAFTTPGDVNVVAKVELCNMSNTEGQINLSGLHIWNILNHVWKICDESDGCDPEVEPGLQLEDGDGWEMGFYFKREML